MKEATTRQQEFMRELGNLCLKYGAEIEAIEEGDGELATPAIEVTLLPKWIDGDVTEDFCQFTFQSCNFMDAE